MFDFSVFSKTKCFLISSSSFQIMLKLCTHYDWKCPTLRSFVKLDIWRFRKPFLGNFGSKSKSIQNQITKYLIYWALIANFYVLSLFFTKFLIIILFSNVETWKTYYEITCHWKLVWNRCLKIVCSVNNFLCFEAVLVPAIDLKLNLNRLVMVQKGNSTGICKLSVHWSATNLIPFCPPFEFLNNKYSIFKIYIWGSFQMQTSNQGALVKNEVKRFFKMHFFHFLLIEYQTNLRQHFKVTSYNVLLQAQDFFLV